uniref:Uncharacterized protein n=1 Tax=Parascaris univalens TaxID=6257 RepID=A0A915AI49_PARUN
MPSVEWGVGGTADAVDAAESGADAERPSVSAAIRKGLVSVNQLVRRKMQASVSTYQAFYFMVYCIQDKIAAQHMHQYESRPRMSSYGNVLRNDICLSGVQEEN